MLVKLIKTFRDDLTGLLYPVTCLVCGDRLRDQTHLCSYCLNYAFVPFEREGRESGGGMILPDWIAMQDALWEFDKGGYLQDVLHHLKYNGLEKLGRALGRQLGGKLRHNYWMAPLEDSLLLPVPLHSSRQRKRGYNQASLIAGGVAEVTGAETVGSNAVIRIRNTATQTGLNARVRRKNIGGAFHLVQSEQFRNRPVIIIDDVITTGATVMELASLIRPEAACIGIVTVAKA